ncbi:MAG: saccharopine dehydrogenase NADP-binding domain-containing protein [Acutalibacteraceae bacterium]
MSKLLVIGCGGVAAVAIHKCCENSGVFSELCIASRTKSKCDALKEKLEKTTSVKLTTAQVDADDVQQLVALIERYRPAAVLNVALPYQDLTIMEACLQTRTDYIDTANYEPENTDDPEWRRIYEQRCREKGFTAYFDYSWQCYREIREGRHHRAGAAASTGVSRVYRIREEAWPRRASHHRHLTATAATTLPFASISTESTARGVLNSPTGRTAVGWKLTMAIKREYDFEGVGKRICTCCILRRSNAAANFPGEAHPLYDVRPDYRH